MLYQLSYASPSHPETVRQPEIRAGTLTLRTNYGTEIKVSTHPPEEQTGCLSRPESAAPPPPTPPPPPASEPKDRSTQNCLDIAEHIGKPYKCLNPPTKEVP